MLARQWRGSVCKVVCRARGSAYGGPGLHTDLGTWVVARVPIGTQVTRSFSEHCTARKTIYGTVSKFKKLQNFFQKKTHFFRSNLMHML